MAKQTKREELEARRGALQQDLAKLEKLASTKAAEVEQLEKLVSSSLAGASLDNLVAEAERQASAKGKAEAARLAAAELGRRIDEHKAAIAQNDQDLAKTIQAELLAQGEAGHHDAIPDAQALLAKVNGLLAIGRELQGRYGFFSTPDAWSYLAGALQKFIEHPEKVAKAQAEAVEASRALAAKEAAKAAQRQARIEEAKKEREKAAREVDGGHGFSRPATPWHATGGK